MKFFNGRITIYNTFDSQFELLPRITFIYGKQNEIDSNGIAFEFLWFGIYIEFLKNKGSDVKPPEYALIGNNQMRFDGD